MIHYHCQYPDNPSSTVIEMSRAEFQELFRPSRWTVSNLETGQRTEVPVGAEEIMCDLCSTDPGDTIYMWLYGEYGCRGYCRSCFENGMKKYCTQIEEGKNDSAQ